MGQLLETFCNPDTPTPHPNWSKRNRWIVLISHSFTYIPGESTQCIVGNGTGTAAGIYFLKQHSPFNFLVLGMSTSFNVELSQCLVDIDSVNPYWVNSFLGFLTHLWYQDDFEIFLTALMMLIMWETSVVLVFFSQHMNISVVPISHFPARYCSLNHLVEFRT